MWPASGLSVIADRTRPDEVGTGLDLTRGVAGRLGEHLGTQLDGLAVQMIGAGMLASDGYGIDFSFEQQGAFLNYSIYPVGQDGRQVSLSGGRFENQTT